MHRILFEKLGPAVWMSHLDTVRLMQRAFRRAGVVLHHSQGYTPHAYVSMPLPLSVGTESLCEILEYELDGELSLKPEDLNAVLPEGIRVLSVYDSEIKTKYMAELQAELRLFYDAGVPETAVRELSELLSRKELMIEKRTKRGLEETDIRPLIHSIVIHAEQKELRLDCRVSAQNPPLNPMLLLTAMERYCPHILPDFAKCRRIEVYGADGNPFR